jgi:NNP family nitrate/nitrite transporter-like MFS transporter
MAWLLILGAIPSGLAGLANNAQSFYVLRFFIGILGATFVPCQAWTSAFFDTNCVGTANALVAGWGEYFNLYLSLNIIIHCNSFRAC